MPFARGTHPFPILDWTGTAGRGERLRVSRRFAREG